MKRAWRTFAVAAAVAALFAACRQYMPSNRYLHPRRSPVTRGTADARGKFDHAFHRPILERQGLTCLHCHRFDAVITAGDDDFAHAVSRRGVHPGGEVCHYCHRNAETRIAAAPGACTTCHENIAPLRPKDHGAGWLQVHKNMARAQPQRCENCHAQSFCIDCHQRRDTIQTRMHERNFRFFHSVEALANPMKCGSCHRQDFCIRCHQQGKVELGK